MNKITFGIATRITHPERKKYLELCIESIINQSDSRWEIIISDDSSTLNIDYWIYEKNPKITIYHQESPLGIFKNFNFCLNKTETTWFLPMGDDDILHPNFVAEILEQAEKDKDIDVIYFDHENIDSNGNVFQITENSHKTGIVHDKWWDADIDSLLWHSPASFFSAIKTKKLLDIGWYPDLWMTTDGYIWFLYFINFRWFYTSKRIAQLRRHKHNASGARSVVKFMGERINLIDAIIKDFWEKISPDWIENLYNQKKDIQNSHINIIKEFQEWWRIQWIKFTIQCIRNWYFWIRSLTITLLWFLLWKNIQLWFNFVSDIYQYIESRIFPLFRK